MTVGLPGSALPGVIKNPSEPFRISLLHERSKLLESICTSGEREQRIGEGLFCGSEPSAVTQMIPT